MWSPLEIRVVLFHYAVRDEFPEESTAYKGAINRLINHDILTPVSDPNSAAKYETTEKGRALVEMWCETPLPETKWFDPRFEKQV